MRRNIGGALSMHAYRLLAEHERTELPRTELRRRALELVALNLKTRDIADALGLSDACVLQLLESTNGVTTDEELK